MASQVTGNSTVQRFVRANRKHQSCELLAICDGMLSGCFIIHPKYGCLLIDVVALYPTWQPQARDFGSTTTTNDNTVLTWHSRHEISLVEVILVLNFKILKLTDDYMQKSGQTIGFGVPPTHRWPYEEEQSGSGGGAGGGISQTRLVCYPP